ncbi:DUF3560 domain-containing protein [Bernardetia sp.]|uniref:DUF3560 domain-containing protein n=1 Tax=Bernardetia sp. TaxID=1937974 RepID=UPI0025C0D5AB|nr:DUF3560 domain-containing protein [Bernardetia sp.]
MTLGRAYDNIREKGILKKDGKTYKRQPKIKKILKGKETTISFAFNRIVKGFYGIIEADSLQPSHSTGVQNPLHFLPEAQPRNRSTSQSGRETPQLIARNLRPSEIIEGANAYTGAPIANLRGEIIQGNGRGDTLKIYYSLEPNGKIYKEYFLEGCNANFLGFSARTIKKELAKFKKPVLIRFVDVSDDEFIQLGQFQAKDLEAISSETSDTKAKVNRIPETELAKMIEALLRHDKKDDSLSEIIRNSKALTYFVRAKVLRKDELENLTKNGEANAKGVEFVRQFLLQFVFEQSTDPKTSEKFNNLPHHTQRGIEKALLYVLKVHCYSDCEQSNHSITKEVGNAIGAAYELLQTNLSFNAWKNQPSTFEPSPQEKYTKLELELAKIFSEGKTQKSIVDSFKKYAFYATDKEATLVEPKIKALPKSEAINKSFGLSGIDWCECDGDDDAMFDWWKSKKKEYGIKSDMNSKGVVKTKTITVKLPVSINTFKKHGNSVLWDKQKTRNLSDAEFITLWKYTLAANTMLSDSIFPKTNNGDRHVLSQYGKKELVNNANEEFLRRGLDKKYTLFTERKEKSTSIHKKKVEKQPYEMTFKEYLHADDLWKKDFQKFIKVDDEVEKELRYKRLSEEQQQSAYLARREARQFALNTTTELIKERHEYEVKKALSEGKTVPQNVLKDYPELQPKKKDEVCNTFWTKNVITTALIKKGRQFSNIDLLHIPSYEFGVTIDIWRLRNPANRKVTGYRVVVGGHDKQFASLKSAYNFVLKLLRETQKQEIQKCLELGYDVPNKVLAAYPSLKLDWQMTLKEWKSSIPTAFLNKKEINKKVEEHKEIIKKALSEGKTVPQNVLKDYPELQQKTELSEAEKLKIAEAEIEILMMDIDGLSGITKSNLPQPEEFESEKSFIEAYANKKADLAKNYMTKQMTKLPLSSDSYKKNEIQKSYQAGYRFGQKNGKLLWRKFQTKENQAEKLKIAEAEIEILMMDIDGLSGLNGTKSPERTYKINSDGKAELSFDYQDYKSLSSSEKQDIKRNFLFSRGKSAWISRGKFPNIAFDIIKKFGFTLDKKEERKTFEQQIESKKEKAESRADRFLKKSEKATQKAKNLQSAFNRYRKDWSWLTQPITNSSQGRAFANHKSKVARDYDEGIREYEKSNNYIDKANSASKTAEFEKYSDLSFLQRKIKEVEKSIKKLDSWLPNYIEKVSQLDDVEENKTDILKAQLYFDQYTEKIEEKAFLVKKLKDLQENGAIIYNKENLKNARYVKLKASYGNYWVEVKKLNPKTVGYIFRSEFGGKERINKELYENVVDVVYEGDNFKVTPRTDNTFFNSWHFVIEKQPKNELSEAEKAENRIIATSKKDGNILEKEFTPLSVSSNDIDWETAVESFKHYSRDANGRAASTRLYYVSHLKYLYNKYYDDDNLTDTQKEAVFNELMSYKTEYKNALMNELRAGAGTSSWLITGRSKRNNKQANRRNKTLDTATDKLVKLSSSIEPRLKNIIFNNRSEEQIKSDNKKQQSKTKSKLFNKVFSSLSMNYKFDFDTKTITEIKNNGWDKNSFKNSVYNTLSKNVKEGNQEYVNEILDTIEEFQNNSKTKIFTSKHKIWKLRTEQKSDSIRTVQIEKQSKNELSEAEKLKIAEAEIEILLLDIDNLQGLAVA